MPRPGRGRNCGEWQFLAAASPLLSLPNVKVRARASRHPKKSNSPETALTEQIEREAEEKELGRMASVSAATAKMGSRCRGWRYE